MSTTTSARAASSAYAARKALEFALVQRPAVFHEFRDPAGGAVENRRADPRRRTRFDPPPRHAQLGKLAVDFPKRRTAQRGQRETRAAEPMDRHARVEHLARTAPGGLAGPVHLAPADLIEDQDLLPGGSQSGGENQSIFSRRRVNSASDTSRGLPLMLCPRELFTRAGI